MDFMIQDVQGNKEYHVNIIRWLQRERGKKKWRTEKGKKGEKLTADYPHTRYWDKIRALLIMILSLADIAAHQISEKN